MRRGFAASHSSPLDWEKKGGQHLSTISAPAPVRPQAATLPPKSRRHRVLDGLYPYAYIAPSLAFMVIASFFPIIFTIFIAFTNYGYGHFVDFQWVGWANFQQIFSIDLADFIPVLIWTVVFAAVSTLLNFSGGLVLAYLLNNENMWERNFYRNILIIPGLCPGVIAILAWGQGILNGSGLINSILIQLHLQPVYWLLDANWSRFWVIVVNFWLGSDALGALQSMSPEVLQAAEIDGANGVQKFFRVTLPLLRSATLPLLIATFAYNMNNFGIVYLLTSGGPECELHSGRHRHPANVCLQNCHGSVAVLRASLRVRSTDIRHNWHPELNQHEIERCVRAGGLR